MNKQVWDVGIRPKFAGTWSKEQKDQFMPVWSKYVWDAEHDDDWAHHCSTMTTEDFVFSNSNEDDTILSGPWSWSYRRSKEEYNEKYGMLKLSSLSKEEALRLVEEFYKPKTYFVVLVDIGTYRLYYIDGKGKEAKFTANLSDAARFDTREKADIAYRNIWEYKEAKIEELTC